MKTYVYSVFDKRINRYDPPRCRTETPEQVSEIMRAGYLQSPKADRVLGLDLYLLGEFDGTKGKLNLLEEKVLVCSNAVFEEECKNV